MDKEMRAAIYIRVSTAEQAMYGKSLTAQKECLEKYAAGHGMRVTGIYADEGKTARKELKKRKAIHRLLEDVRHDEIDMILFWKMDRWFRSVSDFYKVQDILDEHNVKWTAVAEPNISMETRDGRLQLNIMLSIGQNEVDTTSERIRFTVNSMISNGKLVWGENNMPLGYKVAVIDGEKKMVRDEKTAPIVEDIFGYFIRYRCKRKTVMHVQETYGLNFTYTMLRTMLTSEFYIGKYRECRDYCPAYLTLEQWEEIRKISSRNIKAQPSGRIYLFSGLMRCPVCRQRLVGTGCSSIINRKTGEKRTYCYYRCNKAALESTCAYTHRLSQNLIEEYFLSNLDREFKKYALRCSRITGTGKREKKSRTADSVTAEMERLNLLFQKGRVSLDYYDRQYAVLEDEKRRTCEQSTPVRIKNYDYLTGLLSKDFSAMYGRLDPQGRQAFWHTILSEIHISMDHGVEAVDFF